MVARHVPALAVVTLLAGAAPALAPAMAQDAKPGCGTAAATTPATPPAPDEKTSGTSPGSMGSTGWSGGLGGSNIGTSQQGPTPGSPSQQPATAQGLDPTGPAAPTNQQPKC